MAPLLVLAVPILDTSFVVLKRLKYRRPPWRADHNHFYHRFMRIGFSQRRTAAYLHLWALMMAGYALLARFVPPRPRGDWDLERSLLLAGVGLLVIGASVWMVYSLEILKAATCTRSACAASARTRTSPRRIEGGARRSRRAHARANVTASYAQAGQRELQQVAGIAPHALGERARGLGLEGDRVRVGEQLQPPLAHELLVDAAQRALEHRPHRRAEHGRLAVHRAAGGHEHVGERDEAAAVDGRARATTTRSRPSARTSARCWSVRASTTVCTRCSAAARRSTRASSGVSEPPR